MDLPKITIFSTCKPFVGEIARIQRNAIRSWLALTPRPEIIILGDDPGTAEACREFGLIHVPEVEKAPSGAPYLDDLFRKAARTATSDLLCYTNADIILTQRFIEAVGVLFAKLGPCIATAAPWNLEVKEDLNPEQGADFPDIFRTCSPDGSGPTLAGADVFLFPKGRLRQVPRMILGRWWWDNVLMYEAAVGDLPAVDITEYALVIHQAHPDTTHGTPGSSSSMSSLQIADEIGINRRAAPRWKQLFWRVDLPWVLRADGSMVRRPFPRGQYLVRYVRREASHYKTRILERTYGFRRKVGLYRWWSHRSEPA